MENEDDVLPLLQSSPETSTSVNHPDVKLQVKGTLSIRKKNCNWESNETTENREHCDSKNHSPTLDANKVWSDINSVPRIPHIENLDSSDSLIGRERMKIKVIQGCISKPELTFGELKLLGCSSEGFVNDDMRRILWPRLLGLKNEDLTPVDRLENVHEQIPNDVYQQILKDVVRSASHFPPGSTEEEIAAFENEMTQMICWVLHRHKKLNYYQGYNDVAATVLMVMGLQNGLYVLEQISLKFLERFMETTMEKVHQELFFIFALLERVHPTLLQHLENVELFPHFALPEYTTWYAHKYSEHRKLLHRLFDYFLGSPTLMPLYLSTVVVAHRATEIFNTTPDMGHTHKVLCTLPEDLPFETLLVDAKNLYRKYPPESIETDVRDYDNKRRQKEQQWKKTAEKNRQERERRKRLQVAVPHPRLPYRVGSYRTIAVVTVLAIGIYAFLKSSTGLN
ncbi:TBC1 domain family member 20 isoform X2 [Athalia rosae]|uniref:TBC1 domain family member 20 isoform X2 n=1 Tax=Athalia rosae TaxID=37344 RepID=UPI002033459F|nr:TBC1 domain family member 20 isoform X2 [Athalia rosae]